jgi:hypothetical protein
VEPQKDSLKSSSSEAEHELKAANEEWVKALAQRNGAALDQIIADEFELAYPFEGDDKDQFIAAVVSGDLRVDSLTAHSNRDLTGNYRFLRVYTRQHGAWRILALHLCLPGQH